jgi:hypothetical protein
MKRVAVLLVSIAALAGGPLRAEAPTKGVDDGFSLMEEGAKLILRGMADRMKPALDEAQKGLGQALAEWEPALRGLAGKVGDLSAYDAPVMMPNGDIIIRRKVPAGPQMPGTSLGPNGETEL